MESLQTTFTQNSRFLLFLSLHVIFFLHTNFSLDTTSATCNFIKCLRGKKMVFNSHVVLFISFFCDRIRSCGKMHPKSIPDALSLQIFFRRRNYHDGAYHQFYHNVQECEAFSSFVEILSPFRCFPDLVWCAVVVFPASSIRHDSREDTLHDEDCNIIKL